MELQALLELIDRAAEEQWEVLDLDRKNISEIPSAIGKLTKLTSLNLAGNKITEIPTAIGKLTNLTSLDLSHNYRITKISAAIGKLKKLSRLILFGNKIVEISHEIGELINLTSLNLSHNQITEISAEIGKLEKLTSLDLAGNKITEIPTAIGELTNLNSLNLSHNQIIKISDAIGKLTNLTSLKLNSNQIAEVPLWFQPNQLKEFEFMVVTFDNHGNEIQQEQKSNRYFVQSLGEINAVDVPYLNMVEIPSKFLISSASGEENKIDLNHPQVSSLFMAKYPVTQAQWRAVVKMPQVAIDLMPEPSTFNGDNLPVETISWLNVQEFCRRLTNFYQRQNGITNWIFRLPTIVEWEYACRAGTTTDYYFGDTLTLKLANYSDRTNLNDTVQQTTAVGNYLPNAFGLYDLHGNVYEWCEDWYDNPMQYGGGFDRDKFICGGAWNSNFYACKLTKHPEHTHYEYDRRYIGFRVVYALAGTP